MKKLFTLLVAAALSLTTANIYADDMKKDNMGKGEMKGDAMSKDEMKR
jgi:pentapeptide MXKDX repeat protein